MKIATDNLPHDGVDIPGVTFLHVSWLVGPFVRSGTARANTDLRPERAVDSSLGPDERIERTTVFETMQAVIQTELTDEQRTAWLAEMKGMPQDEITRRLCSNRNAVYKLTHDARNKRKHRLEAAGYRADWNNHST